MAGIFAYIAFELYCAHFQIFVYGQTEPVRECWCILSGGCDFSRVLGGPTNTNYNKENVALGKPVKISSNLQSYMSNIHRERAGCVAVNGNTGYYYYGLGNTKFKANCFHSAASDRESSWEVDLKTSYTITEITVYPRHQFQNRIVNTTITVDNKFCYKFSKHLPDYNPITIKCATPLRGRIVKMKKDRWPSNQIWRAMEYSLNLCEFQVWVCKKGYYGEDCDQICDNCKECDNYYGTCIGDCQDSYFGINCNQRCLNCLDSKCDRSGTCTIGCQGGVSKDKCNTTVCRTGYYGEKCEVECPNCFENKCDYHGMCLLGCATGWKGDKCNEACKIGYYGRGCTQTCFTCLDRKCRVNGFCIAGCEEGWIGDTCTTATYSEYRGEFDSSNRFAAVASAVIVLCTLATSTIIWIVVMWIKRAQHESDDNSLTSLNEKHSKEDETNTPDKTHDLEDTSYRNFQLSDFSRYTFNFRSMWFANDTDGSYSEDNEFEEEESFGVDEKPVESFFSFLHLPTMGKPVGPSSRSISEGSEDRSIDSASLRIEKDNDEHFISTKEKREENDKKFSYPLAFFSSRLHFPTMGKPLESSSISEGSDSRSIESASLRIEKDNNEQFTSTYSYDTKEENSENSYSYPVDKNHEESFIG